MHESSVYKLIDTEVSKLNKTVNSLEGIINICRWVGYSMLIMAFIDIIDVIFPVQIMNPVWEFQTMGALVDRVAIPLVSLLLVLFGKLENRSFLELHILRFISRLTLLVGLLYILLIPVGVSNTVRLYSNNVDQFNQEYKQQLSQVNQLEEQLTKATPSELDTILQRQGHSLDGNNPQEVKNQLLLQIKHSREELKTKAEDKKYSENLRLFKNSVKWNIGALISGFLFIAIWKRTLWARNGNSSS
ncbi:hypothetical protein HCG51_24195 [Tolypothrix sp. PCC 7910]|uniref:HpsJ-like protein, cyanoexosortase A-associated n=1 Tax=Tolypothrix sp. PCC 7910 TaxID=2099387 RepID=UPI00142783B4|nr:HpsJ family protein [Tolypothrix sp. PCC 7910]QIR39498.1 hypothetical protein HCG51_24195 [Tolypothrix sp. PCC 7910]